MIARWNAWLDTIPRMSFVVGSRRVPAFRSLGILGYHVAVVVLILTALSTGMSLGIALCIATIAAFTFFGWALLRRALTKRETIVVLEHVWITYGLIALFGWAIRAPLPPLFDVFSVAVATFIAFGRLGCATAGCCHGYPSGFGIVYGDEHHLPPRLTGVRLFPVQLIEAGVLFLISLVAFLCTSGPPGMATVWFLASYAVARFGLQRLRADRHSLAARAPIARAMCVMQLGAAVVLDVVWIGAPVPAWADRVPDWAVAAGMLVIAGAAASGVLIHGARRRSDLLHPDHLDEAWAAVSAPIPPGRVPAAQTTSRGMTIATSSFDGLRHVSFSHPDESTLAVALSLGAASAFDRNGITHFSLAEPAPRMVVPANGDAPPKGMTDAAAPPARAASYFSAPSPSLVTEASGTAASDTVSLR